MINVISLLQNTHQNTYSTKENFLVCAMYTKSHLHYEKRLMYSLTDFSLPFSLYCSTDIHESISMKGSEDMRFSKHLFISSCLRTFNIPIVYLDIDVVITQYPDLFNKITTDFAIYNWLSDIENTAYIYNEISKAYQLSHEIRYYSQDQLVSTGPVSYWKPTIPTLQLLDSITNYIAKNPMSSDDHTVDICFNYRDFDITYTWLPKEYIRFPWHPHIKPVILHTDWPAPEQNRPTNKIERFNKSKCISRTNLPQNINSYKLYIYE